MSLALERAKDFDGMYGELVVKIETTYKYGVILPLVMPFLEPVMDYTNFGEVLREFIRSVKMVSKCDRIYT